MNQIKFRAWNGKEMIVPTAVINGKAAILKPCNDNREMTDDEGVHYYCNWDMDVVTNYPLMQFTGLQDKNGVDIYEGDIVSLWYAPRATAKGKIKFENGGFYFKTTEAKPEIALAYNCVYEYGNSFTVIGNIHENPELLENVR